MNDKLLSALSMARGAGKLKIGFDACRDAVMSGAPMAVIASDVSERTASAVHRFCEGLCSVVTLDETQSEIEMKFGRRFGVAAVTDGNFASLIRKNLRPEQEENEW